MVLKKRSAAEAPPVGGQFPSRVAELLEHRDQLVPVLRSISAEFPPSRYRRQLAELAQRLESGATAEQLCASASLRPALLPLLAGRAQPSQADRQLHAIFRETVHDQQLRRQRTRAVAYPLTILAISAAILVFLCLAVVPVFDEITTSFGLEPPELTHLLVGFSRLLRSEPWKVALFATGACALAYACYRFLLAIRWFDRPAEFLFRGSSRRVSAMAAFARNVADGLAADLPLAEVLVIAGAANQDRRVSRAAQKLARAAADAPQSLSTSLAARSFPRLLTYALSVGAAASVGSTEASTNKGDVPRLSNRPAAIAILQVMADSYGERVQLRVGGPLELLGPMATLAVGIVVGVIVLALFLPMVQVINGLSG